MKAKSTSWLRCRSWDSPRSVNRTPPSTSSRSRRCWPGSSSIAVWRWPRAICTTRGRSRKCGRFAARCSTRSAPRRKIPADRRCTAATSSGKDGTAGMEGSSGADEAGAGGGNRLRTAPDRALSIGSPAAGRSSLSNSAPRAGPGVPKETKMRYKVNGGAATAMTSICWRSVSTGPAHGVSPLRAPFGPVRETACARRPTARRGSPPAALPPRAGWPPAAFPPGS